MVEFQKPLYNNNYNANNLFVTNQEASKILWRIRVSIPVPLACKASALPFELIPLTHTWSFEWKWINIWLWVNIPCNTNYHFKQDVMDLHQYLSRVAQRKRAGPITQRSVDRNHPLLRTDFIFFLSINRARPGVEPGTSRTRSANHTTRPTGQIDYVLVKQGMTQPTDSSVGRAEDCRGNLSVILRSLVQIRLGGDL